MQLWLHIFVVFAALLLVQEFFRRTGPLPAWIVFLALPIALTPYWFRESPNIGLFPWVKLYSLVFSACWGTAVRFTRLGTRAWARALMASLLAINIVEAMVKDAHGSNAAHYLVVASGFLVLVTMPDPLTSLVVDAGNFRDMHYRNMTRLWVVEYSIWNWAFVYLNFPAIAGHHLGVLSAALAIGLYDPRLWLQARGYSLAIDLMFLPTFPRQIVPWTDTSHWSTPWRENLVAAICLSLISAATARLVVNRRRMPDIGAR